MIVKDPALAGVLSFVLPGTGQIYARKPVKGMALLLIEVGALAMAISSPPGPTEPRPSWGQISGVGIAAMTWIYSMATAPGDARAYNRRERERIRRQ